MRALALLAVLALATCEPNPPIGAADRPAAGTGTAAPPLVAAWDGRPDSSKWTGLLADALTRGGGALLTTAPADIDDFCPAYAGLDESGRHAFYVGLLSKMADLESGFNPATSYEESFADSQGNPVISRGLLQLSFESANAYPGCDPASPQALHDPATNLTCAVAIMNRLVPRDGVIGARRGDAWRGAAAYWSVQRPAEAPADRGLHPRARDMSRGVMLISQLFAPSFTGHDNNKDVNVRSV